MRNGTTTILPPAFTVDRVIVPANTNVDGYAAIVNELRRGEREDARNTVRPGRGGK